MESYKFNMNFPQQPHHENTLGDWLKENSDKINGDFINAVTKHFESQIRGPFAGKAEVEKKEKTLKAIKTLLEEADNLIADNTKLLHSVKMLRARLNKLAWLHDS